MRKIIAVVLWAWIPFCGQPLRGQAPSEGVQAAHNQKQKAALRAADPGNPQIGTEARPAFVELKDRPKSKDEAAEDRRKNDTKEYRDAGTFYAAVASATIGGLLLIVGALGVKAALSTLDAIKDQGKQADRHLVLIERPWLDPHIQLNGPLEIGMDGGISLPIVIDISNLGKSPATAITIIPQLWIKSRHENILDALKSLCDQSEGQCMHNVDFGDVLFPGPASQYRIERTIDVLGEDMQRYSWNGVYDAFILLCVAYRSTLDDKIVHYTALTYHIVKVREPPNIPTVFNVGEIVPPNGLRLSRWFVGPRIK